jgi:hypothetical protein
MFAIIMLKPQIMKKFLLLLVASFTFIACETEPLDPSLRDSIVNVPDPTTNSIVGSWNYTDADIETTSTTSIMGVTVTTVSRTEYVSSNIVLTFNADGTYTTTGDATYNYYEDGMLTDTDTDNYDDRGNYVINNNRLILTSTDPNSNSLTDDAAIFTIVILNATNLDLDVSGTFTENILGTTIDVSLDGFLDFERQ